MIWDGTIESFTEIQKEHPSAVVYPMQSKTPEGKIVLDPLNGEPMLVIESRRTDDTWRGWVFGVGENVV